MAVIWSPAGLSLSAQEQRMLQSPYTAGVIFFAYNYENPEQIKRMINELREYAADADLLISVDQEGGRVQRFVAGRTKLPPMSCLGELYAQDAQQGLDAAYAMGRLCGAELKELRINTNYAPVLDVDHGVSKMIRTRSFSSDPEAVAALALSYLSGLRAAGIIGAGKHFPGHGGVSEDSHETVPRDTRAAAAIDADIQVFSRVMPQLELLLTSHILLPELDAQPVTFSPYWLKQKLRTELGYQGLILSDDLSMGAVKQSYADPGDAVLAALDAGCDIALLCNNVDGARQALKKLEQSDRDPSPVKGKIQQLLAKYSAADSTAAATSVAAASVPAASVPATAIPASAAATPAAPASATPASTVSTAATPAASASAVPAADFDLEQAQQLAAQLNRQV